MENITNKMYEYTVATPIGEATERTADFFEVGSKELSVDDMDGYPCRWTKVLSRVEISEEEISAEEEAHKKSLKRREEIALQEQRWAEEGRHITRKYFLGE